MKKTIVLISLAAILFLGVTLVQAKPGEVNQPSDVERGVFVHYPHAKGQGGGGGSVTGDQVNDFKYNGIHWLGAMPDISYQINPANKQGLSDKEIRDAVDAAFTEWTNHNPTDGKYIRFSDAGFIELETSVNPSRDNFNTVSFEPLDSTYPNAIAVTFYWYSRGTKTLLETDTVFNSDLPWSVSGDSSSYDLQNIATHEFGHWLLLGDLYSLKDLALTMYGYGRLGEIIKRDLGKGDISGINKIY